MIRMLVLGATGRTGAAVLRALPPDVEVIAAVRNPAGVDKLAETRASISHEIVDLGDLQPAMRDVNVVVNAIRLRGDIAATELVSLHERIRAAGGRELKIVTVGGAGALHVPGGQRLWQSPAFPTATLPRGRAHAVLRDYVEERDDGSSYLIPPPQYDPEGPAQNRWERLAPSADEWSFTSRAISYTDFGAAVVETALEERVGTELIAWPVSLAVMQ